MASLDDDYVDNWDVFSNNEFFAMMAWYCIGSEVEGYLRKYPFATYLSDACYGMGRRSWVIGKFPMVIYSSIPSS